MDPVTALTKRQLLNKRWTALESDRSGFISLWQHLNDFILPTRGRFVVTDKRGDRRSKFIIDSTGTIAARTCASGMMSGITSPARPWFRLTTPDPDMAEFGPVKRYLYLCTERLRWILARSNFYRVAPLAYQDMAVFATAAVYCVENDHTVVRFQDYPLGSFVADLDDDNRPALIMREFRMSVRQMVAKFGLKVCSRAVQDLYRNGDVETRVEIVHAILPNDKQDPTALHSKDAMPWSSYYYEKGAPDRGGDTPAFLRESGYHEFPAMLPRWEVTGEDVYGTNSPGITALGDVKQLQTGEKLSLQAVEKMVKPPLTGPESLRSVRVSILPGEVTYHNTRDGMQGLRPIHETKLSINELELKQQQKRAIIERAFFSDLFLMLSALDDREQARERTAAEIYERHEEKLLALGPVLEQLNQDWLDPTIDRTFNIANRRGLMPIPPKELEGMDLKVEYISTMHQAQKSTGISSIRSVLEVVMPLAETDPSVLDKIDLDNVVDHVADMAGAPPDIVRAQDEVDEIRGARAQAAQKQAQTEQLAAQASAAKDLSETDTSQPSALQDLMASEQAEELNVGA